MNLTEIPLAGLERYVVVVVEVHARRLVVVGRAVCCWLEDKQRSPCHCHH